MSTVIFYKNKAKYRNRKTIFTEGCTHARQPLCFLPPRCIIIGNCETFFRSHVTWPIDTSDMRFHNHLMYHNPERRHKNGYCIIVDIFKYGNCGKRSQRLNVKQAARQL